MEHERLGRFGDDIFHQRARVGKPTVLVEFCATGKRELLKRCRNFAHAQLGQQPQGCAVDGLQLCFAQGAITTPELARRTGVHFGGGRQASLQSRRAGVGATALTGFLGCHAGPWWRSR